jgi:CRP-like cAMP-binding protein
VLWTRLPGQPIFCLQPLPLADFELLRPYLETTELVQEEVLVGAGDHLTRVFFPNSGVISLVVSLANGEMVEVAMIGKDSVFGGTAALDGDISLTNAIVQLPGSASTLDVGQLRIAANRSVSFRTILIRHEQALFAQTQQSAACNASHSVEARLARCLLRLRDLAGNRRLPLTQDFLAQMIGVQRNSVSTVANALQHAGILKYNRGHIEITDIDGLKGVACECYDAVEEQYKRLLTKD